MVISTANRGRESRARQNRTAYLQALRLILFKYPGGQFQRSILSVRIGSEPQGWVSRDDWVLFKFRETIDTVQYLLRST